MTKQLVIALFATLVGCQSLSTNNIYHERFILDEGQYEIQTNSLQFTVGHQKNRSYYRPGAHDSWGSELLESKRLNIKLQFADDMDEISATIEPTPEKNIQYKTWQALTNVCTNPSDSPLNALPKPQQTYNYRLSICSESLVIESKESGNQCVIDLNAFNEQFTKSTKDLTLPLSRQFGYSVQDADGSVFIWRLNLGEENYRGRLNLHRLSCHEDTKLWSLQKKGFNDYYYLKMSHYGTPTSKVTYNNNKRFQIVTLQGDIQFDGPMMFERGWLDIFLPDLNSLYSIDIVNKDTNNHNQFELVIKRFNYGKNSVEEKRILIEHPIKQ